MDTKNEDLYFQKLSEWILDENKIITCTLAASKWNVSIENAKQLLDKYLNDQRSLKNDLSAVYWVSGILQNGNKTIMLIRDDQLEMKKKLFETISGEFIYSLQKAKDIDLNLLTSVNQEVHDNRTGPLLGIVKGNNCIRVSTPDVKQTIKEEPVTTVSSTKVIHSNKKQKINFFTQTQSQSKTPKSQNETKSNIKNEIIEKSPRVEKTPSTEPTIEKKVDQKKQNNKRPRKDKHGEQLNKKRKRIEEICDSDSSDMFGNEKEEEENMILSDSDQENKTKKVLPPKNKKRKAVDETFVDDEGFTVTKTVYVYESASDNDSENTKVVVDVNPTTLMPKKMSSTDSERENSGNLSGNSKNKKKNKKEATGKQKTLLSFFKKA